MSTSWCPVELVPPSSGVNYLFWLKKPQPGLGLGDDPSGKMRTVVGVYFENAKALRFANPVAEVPEQYGKAPFVVVMGSHMLPAELFEFYHALPRGPGIKDLDKAFVCANGCGCEMRCSPHDDKKVPGSRFVCPECKRVVKVTLEVVDEGKPEKKAEADAS